jgi:fructose/tagatose bisphosphate aldolase
VLNGIKTNMITNFIGLDANKIKSYTEANTAFNEDIKTMIDTYPKETTIKKEVTTKKPKERNVYDDVYSSKTDDQTTGDKIPEKDYIA